jgi:flagellar motor switch protein FliM
MTDTKNIMRLKTVAPRRDTAEITPPIALQRAIYRAAHLGMGLTLDITETRADQCDRDGVLSGVQPTDLIVKLTQEDEGPGVMALDLDLVSALVEVQTLGAAMDAPATSRKVTSTDAAVALPLIDGTLSGFESLLAQVNEAEPPGFHFGDWLRDLNLLAAQLPDGPYDSFEVTVSIGKNGRAGRLFLALPVPPKPAPTDPQIKDNSAQDSLSAEIMDAPARLDVV